MSTSLSLRRLLIVVGLTVMWCALWQTFSFANVAGGLLLSLAITALDLGPRAIGSIRLVPLMKLLWIVFVDLVRSTISVAVEVLTPTDHTDEAIIAIPLPDYAKDHFLVLTLAITLTPGTAVVDANPATSTIFVHLLHASDRASTIAHAERLAALAEEALPAESEVLV